jgi:hypothetical protein
MTLLIHEATNPLKRVNDELQDVSSISSEVLSAVETDNARGDDFFLVQGAVQKALDNIGTSLTAGV